MDKDLPQMYLRYLCEYKINRSKTINTEYASEY